jgi:hypothetical protein
MAQLAEQTPAIHSRHHNIDHENLRDLLEGELDGALRLPADHQRIAGAGHKAFVELERIGVVIDDQNAGGAGDGQRDAHPQRLVIGACLLKLPPKDA